MPRIEPIPPRGPRRYEPIGDLDDEDVDRAIRAIERQFSRWRGPRARRQAFVVVVVVAAIVAAVVLAPRLVETIHAGWARLPI